MRWHLPANILARPKKGFGIPLAKWLRELAPAAGAVPFLRPEAVARRWKEHRSGTADHRLFLWTWLSLQQCLNQGLNATVQQGAAVNIAAYPVEAKIGANCGLSAGGSYSAAS
jgi:hypothetical protein